jgi:hypothetical protein
MTFEADDHVNKGAKVRFALHLEFYKRVAFEVSLILHSSHILSHLTLLDDARMLLGRNQCGMSNSSSPKNALKSIGLVCSSLALVRNLLLLTGPIGSMTLTTTMEPMPMLPTTMMTMLLKMKMHRQSQRPNERLLCLRHRHRRHQLQMLCVKLLVMELLKLRVRKRNQNHHVPVVVVVVITMAMTKMNHHRNLRQFVCHRHCAWSCDRQLICWWFCVFSSTLLECIRCTARRAHIARRVAATAAQEFSSCRTSGGTHWHCDWFVVHCASRVHSGIGSMACRRQCSSSSSLDAQAQTRMRMN